MFPNTPEKPIRSAGVSDTEFVINEYSHELNIARWQSSKTYSYPNQRYKKTHHGIIGAIEQENIKVHVRQEPLPSHEKERVPSRPSPSGFVRAPKSSSQNFLSRQFPVCQ